MFSVKAILATVASFFILGMGLRSMMRKDNSLGDLTEQQADEMLKEHILTIYPRSALTGASRRGDGANILRYVKWFLETLSNKKLREVCGSVQSNQAAPPEDEVDRRAKFMKTGLDEAWRFLFKPSSYEEPECIAAEASMSRALEAAGGRKVNKTMLAQAFVWYLFGNLNEDEMRSFKIFKTNIDATYNQDHLKAVGGPAAGHQAIYIRGEQILLHEYLYFVLYVLNSRFRHPDAEPERPGSPSELPRAYNIGSLDVVLAEKAFEGCGVRETQTDTITATEFFGYLKLFIETNSDWLNRYICTGKTGQEQLVVDLRKEEMERCKILREGLTEVHKALFREGDWHVLRNPSTIESIRGAYNRKEISPELAVARFFICFLLKRFNVTHRLYVQKYFSLFKDADAKNTEVIKAAVDKHSERINARRTVVMVDKSDTSRPKSQGFKSSPMYLQDFFYLVTVMASEAFFNPVEVPVKVLKERTRTRAIQAKKDPLRPVLEESEAPETESSQSSHGDVSEEKPSEAISETEPVLTAEEESTDLGVDDIAMLFDASGKISCEDGSDGRKFFRIVERFLRTFTPEVARSIRLGKSDVSADVSKDDVVMTDALDKACEILTGPAHRVKRIMDARDLDEVVEGDIEDVLPRVFIYHLLTLRKNAETYPREIRAMLDSLKDDIGIGKHRKEFVKEENMELSVLPEGDGRPVLMGIDEYLYGEVCHTYQALVGSPGNVGRDNNLEDKAFDRSKLSDPDPNDRAKTRLTGALFFEYLREYLRSLTHGMLVEICAGDGEEKETKSRVAAMEKAIRFVRKKLVGPDCHAWITRVMRSTRKEVSSKKDVYTCVLDPVDPEAEDAEERLGRALMFNLLVKVHSSSEYPEVDAAVPSSIPDAWLRRHGMEDVRVVVQLSDEDKPEGAKYRLSTVLWRELYLTSRLASAERLRQAALAKELD